MKTTSRFHYVSMIQQAPTSYYLSSGETIRNWHLSVYSSCGFSSKIFTEKDLIDIYSGPSEFVFTGNTHRDLSHLVLPNIRVVTKIEDTNKMSEDKRLTAEWLLGINLEHLLKVSSSKNNKLVISYYIDGKYHQKKISPHELESFLHSSDVVHNRLLYSHPGVSKHQ